VSSAITGRRIGALAATLAAGAAIAAPSALAADVPVAGGTTDLHLNAATAGALTDAGLSVAPVGPASARGLRVAFPITGGAIDPATAVGRVTHSGGLAFSAHGTTVRLTNFIVNTAASRPVLTAAVGSARIPLAGIDLSDARVIRRGSGGIDTWVVRARADLTPAAAAALNAAFGTDLPGGVNIGRVDLKATPAQVLLAGGGTTLGLDAGTAKALTSLGVTPSVIAPGTATAAGLRFPITSGRLRVGTFAGTIAHSGGIALTAGATVVQLKNFRINITGSPNLTAQVGDSSTRVPLAVDLAGARVGISNRTAVVRGAKVSLTAESAAALNAAFKVSALTAGLPLGVADVRGQVR
jgi:hypothetical protein